MASKPIKVLIVDDSAIVRKLLADSLKGEPDIEVVGGAGDPFVARDMILRLEPDVLTLDIEMPRMDGFEFLSTIRAQKARADLPIVMLTSRSGDKHRGKATALGATDYMVKPFQEDVLIRNIDRLVQASRRTSARAAS